MARVCLNTQSVHRLMPVLMRGAVCDRIYRLQWTPRAVEIGIEMRFMLDFVLSPWIVEILALLEERTGHSSVLP